MDLISNGWFSEANQEMWPGQALSLKVEDVLWHEKSGYQDILVFKSATYGRVLVLDGVIQITERDEFSYQEMITFLALNSHPNPERVLIVGGGDGGVAREAVKHPSVQRVFQCELDAKVVELSKRFFPSMSVAFNSPKLKLTIGDGFEFMRKHTGQFDVIITDSSDPIGPASLLFGEEYFMLMKNALRPGGIVCSQGECLWLHGDVIKKVMDFSKTIYPVVEYGYTCIPTYPCGQIGFVLCGTDESINFREPLTIFSEDEKEALQLRYYNEDIHRAAFALPQFARKMFSS